MASTAQLIDGKALAEKILEELRATVMRMPRLPALAAVMIGDDRASQLFIERKKKACARVGITFHEYQCGNQRCLPDITADGLNELIDWVNTDPDIDAIIVQLPVPKNFDTDALIARMNPEKDVDGFHPENFKKFLNDTARLTPPLILAIEAALRATGEPLDGKTAVLISKSPIFSTPLCHQLKKLGLRAETMQPDDPQLPQATRAADVVLSIVGRKHFITADMLKPGAIVVDAGTTLEQTAEGKQKLFGDFHPDAQRQAGWLTPVPGGVGPLTVAMLLKNVVALAQQRQNNA